MNIGIQKSWLLGLIIILVDLATASNVFESYAYFERKLFAILVSIAFVALQVGTLVLYAQPLPAPTRRWLFAGACILLTVTGLANVAMAFERSRAVFPAEALVPVLGFGGDARSLGVAAAWIAGLALVVVGLIFWSALGLHVREERQREQQVLKGLDDLFKTTEQKLDA